jgi:uncharacterized cupredoxin-like copper-binding protein
MMLLTSFVNVSAVDYIPPTTPVINHFTASATNIVIGETVTLSWDISDAIKVELIGLEKVVEEEDLPLKGDLLVWPMASTTYVLNAYGENGSMVSKSVDVNVDSVGPVQILSFTASPEQVKSGETTTLHWQVKNAKTIDIIGIEKLPEELKEIPIVEGELEVWPMATTTYVLQAVGYKGEVTSEIVTVSVVNDPVEITSLTVTPNEIELDETAVITWKTKNAAKVKISGVDEELPANGSIEVKPDKTGVVKYTVTAVGLSGDLYIDCVSLNVKEPVSKLKIISFEASKYEVSRGTLVKISWTTEGAVECMIVTSDGISLKDRPANGSISITPNVTRSYTLIAYGDNGKTVEKTIKIVVK